jgi:hypothetical protein
MIRRTLFFVMPIVLLSLLAVGLGVQSLPRSYAQDDPAATAPVSVPESEEETACTQITTLALETVDELCQGIGRNQACYGNLMVNATPRVSTEDLIFNKAGDIASLNAIRSLTLGGLDIANQEWGVAMMRLQANLPDTLPGQNVTFLLFGDVELEDVSTTDVFVPMAARVGVNVRLAPSDTSPILGSFAQGAQIEAAGRFGDWVQVKYAAHPGLTGWVSAELVDGDVVSLPEVEVRSQVETPMQSVYFKSGVGEPQCEDAPQDGLLIQSPKGLGLVRFSVNGVELQMGSTAFVSIENDAMSYTLLEGKAFVTSEEVIQRVYPGQETHVELDESGEAVSGPTYPQPYEAAPLDFLRPMLGQLPDPVDYLPAPMEPQSPLISAQEIADFVATNKAIASGPVTRATPSGFPTSIGVVIPGATWTGTPVIASPTETPFDAPTETPAPVDTEIGEPSATNTDIPVEVPTDIPPTDVPPTDVPPTDIPPTDVPPTDLPTEEVPTDIPPTDNPPTDVPITENSPSPMPPTPIPPTPVPPTEPAALCQYQEDIEALAIFIAEPTVPKGVKYDLYLLDKDCNEVYVSRVRRLKPAVFLTHVSRVWIVRDGRNGNELLRWTPTVGGEFTVWISGGTPGDGGDDEGGEQP